MDAQLRGDDPGADEHDVDDDGVDERRFDDGLWERMRAEERAEQLSQIVQDTVRNARVADALAAAEGPPSRRD